MRRITLLLSFYLIFMAGCVPDPEFKVGGALDVKNDTVQDDTKEAESKLEVVDISGEVSEFPCETDDDCKFLEGKYQCKVPYCNKKKVCDFKNKKDKSECDDGNLCTENDVCKKGKCVGEEVNCDDNNECTTDFCVETKGCQHVNNKNVCTPDDKCALFGVCNDGKCEVLEPVDCDDNNPCTKDSCDPETGCVYENIDGESCDDGNPCTLNDVCVDGVCQGKLKSCDASAPCNIGVCDPLTGECVDVPYDGLVCDDGNPCTEGDFCSDGQCVGLEKDCDDNNPCTEDSCDPEKGCVHEKLAGQGCDDGNPCTENDVCIEKEGCTGTPDECMMCKGEMKDCDDQNPCTKDFCDIEKGCVHEKLDGVFCDDGDSCTVGDKCVNGVCKGGSQIDCDDNNPCTIDSCDKEKGCVHEEKQAGSCNDNNPCTTNDTCIGGKCIGIEKTCPPLDPNNPNPCIIGKCDPLTGNCIYKVNYNAEDEEFGECDDGDKCTIDDKCTKDFKCVGTPVDCNDGNACTKDFCDKKTGECKHVEITSPEDAGCLTAGVCKGKVKVTCDSENNKIVCDYSNVPNYEETEISCDGLDNDCDGTVDENLCVVCKYSDAYCKDGVPYVCNKSGTGFVAGSPCDENQICVSGLCIGNSEKNSEISIEKKTSLLTAPLSDGQIAISYNLLQNSIQYANLYVYNPYNDIFVLKNSFSDTKLFDVACATTTNDIFLVKRVIDGENIFLSFEKENFQTGKIDTFFTVSNFGTAGNCIPEVGDSVLCSYISFSGGDKYINVVKLNYKTGDKEDVIYQKTTENIDYLRLTRGFSGEILFSLVTGNGTIKFTIISYDTTTGSYTLNGPKSLINDASAFSIGKYDEDFSVLVLFSNGDFKNVFIDKNLAIKLTSQKIYSPSEGEKIVHFTQEEYDNYVVAFFEVESNGTSQIISKFIDNSGLISDTTISPVNGSYPALIKNINNVYYLFYFDNDLLKFKTFTEF